MKKSKALVLASTAFLLSGVVGCGTKPVTSRSTLTVCIASEPKSIDPALNSSVDGATMLVHLDSGLYRYQQKANSSDLELTYDLAEDIHKETARVVDHVENEEGAWEEVAYESGVRYTVTLRDGIKWSDGTAITSDDFIYSWNRASGAALGADYCYIFECICDGVWNESDEDCPGLAVTKISDKQFTIDLMVDVAYFDQLLAFPAFFPVQKATVEAHDTETPGTWATEPSSYVSCGAYKLTEWVHNSKIVLTKNPDYWDAANIKATQITFALSDDNDAMFASYQTGEYDMIDDIPQEQIDEIREQYPTQFHITGQMGTYYVCFNVNSTTFKIAGTEENRVKVRQALSLLINRSYLVKNVTKGGQTVANGFVSSGLTDPAGGEYVDHNGPDQDGSGYFNKGETTEEYLDNVDEAIELLKDAGYNYDESTKKFTNVEAFTYLYNTSDAHKAIAENIKDTLANYGITVNLRNEDWSTFLTDRKEGNYDVARNGWVADYDDPSSYLTLWTTISGNNDAQLGKGDHAEYAGYSADVDRDGVKETGLTWAESYDVLVDLSNKETNAEKRFEMLHEIEDLLMETGTICPLYYYTDLYMIKDQVKGFFSSPLGYKFFMYSTYQG